MLHPLANRVVRINQSKLHQLIEWIIIIMVSRASIYAILNSKLYRHACAYFLALESKYPDCYNLGVVIHCIKLSFLLKKLSRKR
jgi:hypothetical protein